MATTLSRGKLRKLYSFDRSERIVIGVQPLTASSKLVKRATMEPEQLA